MDKSMTISDWIQISISVATFFAVIVALFGERIRWKLYGPKIIVEFDKKNERCFRWAIVPSDMLQDQGEFQNVKRYYFRLRVVNRGSTVARRLKAKIELYFPDKNLANRFEPSTLQWISGSEIVNLAGNEDSYFNLISQATEPKDIKYKLRVELANKIFHGIAWNRYLNNWILKVSIHGENLYMPIVKCFKFEPSQREDYPGNLREVCFNSL